MQKVLVILIIVASVGYLAWKFYQKFYKKDTGCEKCGMNDLKKK